ncbi:MAG: S-layer homology domain-containing protein [Clostridia bacterium]|nr:S-layer homology domain-containing protein [Clostridia bacterium]
MKKIILFIIAVLMLVPVSASAQEFMLNGEYHIKYMDGTGDGAFNPDGFVTRAEACQIIYNLMTEKPQVTREFSDVEKSAWYYEPVNALYSAGLIEGKYTGDAYCPEDLISRGEMLGLICQFFDETDAQSSFLDVTENSEYYGVVSTASQNGWINGFSDGTFRPENPITRAELVTVLNRVLDRYADREFIKANDRVRVFTDVEPEHWAYYDITEATVEHNHEKGENEKWTSYMWEPTGLRAGYHMINHYLYYVEENTGQFAVNCEYDGFRFDSRGRYTTGDAVLDSQLHQVIASICTNEPKSEANLEAIYFYVRDNFTYQARQHVPRGATGWELKYAAPMMRSHYGNCYSWASVFMYLTRCAGFESRCQSGTTGKNNNAHGWTEIEFDGVWYVFDPEMENSSRIAKNPNYHKRYYKLPYNNPIRSYVTY